MAVRPSQYQLVSGPFRTAVWSILTRFKEEFVEAAVEAFMRKDMGPRGPISKGGYRALQRRLEWLVHHRAAYETLLASSIETLQKQLPPGSAIPVPADLARQRVDQIQTYLVETLKLWDALLQDNHNREHAFLAISQVVWPYYCVVYQSETDKTAAEPRYNMCTWMPGSNLLRHSGFSSASRQTPGKKPDTHILRLCPTLDRCFAGDSAMPELMDLASRHRLDFDLIEPNLGHVQTLNEPKESFLTIEHLVGRMVDRLPEGAIGDPDAVAAALAQSHSRFTDLFHFTTEATRHIIRKGETDRTGSADPIGVLFLASPILDSLQPIFGGGKTALKLPIKEAWDKANGFVFASEFHADFQALRGQFSEIDEDARAQASIDIAHHSKNLLNSTGALIERAQDNLGDPPALKRILRHAAHVVSYLGLEFGLKERLQAELRDPTNRARLALARLTDDELRELARLTVKMLLTFRAEMDAVHGRRYFLDGEPIDSASEPSSSIEGAIREQLQAVYRRLGEFELADNVRHKRTLGFEKLPLALTTIFIFRELIDNMRPRDSAMDHTTVKIIVGSLTAATHQWRVLSIRQILYGSKTAFPFGPDPEPESITRFNKRMKDAGWAHISVRRDDVSEDGVSPVQPSQINEVSLPR